MIHRRRLVASAATALLVFAAPAARAVGPDADLRPFVTDWSRADESVVNNSQFLDAPAGKHGFVRVEGERLLTGDGKRFRVWGINVCGGSCFPDKAAAKLIADDFARMGFNVVRFHHMEADWGRSIFIKDHPDTRTLNPDSLDRLDYFIAELKARGIYSNLNLNVSRRMRAGDGVRDYEKLGYAKGATYYNPRLIELQHEFARQLLTHKNPYTGAEYRHEPAVATVEIVNENSLLEAWAGWRLVPREVEHYDLTWGPLPASYVEELTDLYNAWLAKHASADDLKQIRGEAGAGDRVPLLRPDEFAKASKPRFHTNARFLVSVEADFFNGMRNLLKDELGVKAPVVGSADHNDRTSGYPHIRSLMLLDIVDGHGYWQHPDLGQTTRSPNTPMVNDPLDSTVAQFARTPTVGKPFTISETNEPAPHEYACENYPILTAYALLHDWDGIYWFDWALARYADPATGILPYGWFDVSADPVKLTNLATCAAMWYRQDVRPAASRVVRPISNDLVVESLRLPKEQSPFFTPGFDEGLALVSATRSSFGAAAAATPAAFPKGQPLGEIISDTKQLGWFDADKQRGVVTVDTDRTQAIIGFAKGSPRFTGGLTVSPDNDFCAVVVTSLDGKPLGLTSKALLTTTSRATNTGFRWTDEKERKTVAEWGKGPVLIEPVTGTVTLKSLGDAKTVTARPLTGEGRPTGQSIAGQRDGTAWRIRVGETVTTWYELTVER